MELNVGMVLLVPISNVCTEDGQPDEHFPSFTVTETANVFPALVFAGDVHVTEKPDPDTVPPDAQ